jgi:nitroreductase
MNEVFKATQERRSVRHFKSTQIDKKKILKILKAAQWAPSFLNLQPWKFIIVIKKDAKERLTRAITLPFLNIVYSRPIPYENLTMAPVIIVTCVDPDRDKLHYIEDGACAVQNMSLVAHSLGLASYWIGVLNTFVEDEVKKILEIPKKYRVIAMMPIGVPNESPKTKREKLQDICYSEKFGNRLTV